MTEGRRWGNLNPYDLHKTLINEYLLTKKGSTSLLQRDTSKDKTDFDVIRENHQFLWDEGNESLTWEKKLAKRYYDKLFKEYCISDLSRFKENKVGMRWRTEQELIDGKGQFTCGNRKCSEKDGLKTWEVNFSYVEHNEKKNALVKLRLCIDCSYKLNYHHKKREIKRLKKNKLKDKPHSDAPDQVVIKIEEDNKDKKDHEPAAESSTSKSDRSITSEDDTEIWRQERTEEVQEEKTQEEEMDDYLDDLFL